MISPLQFNKVSNVNFKGNDTKRTNNYQKPASTLTNDVYQSTAPKKQKGFVEIIKTAVANPIQRAMADFNARKTETMMDINGLVADYQTDRRPLRKQVVSDYQDFNHAGATLDTAITKGINSAPTDGSNRVALGKNSYYEYKATDFRSKYMPNSEICKLMVPTDLVLGEKDTDQYAASERYMDLENEESFTNLTYYKPEANCDVEFEADTAIALEIGRAHV